MNKQELKLLAEIRRQQKLLDKRIARLETLEFSSYVGGWVEIETITTTIPPVSSVTFSNIPQIYLHLVMIISARTYNLQCSPMKIFFNDDEDDVYWHNDHWLGGDVGACTHVCTETFGVADWASYIRIGTIPGVSITHPDIFNDLYNSETLWIPDYRCTYKRKSCHWDNETCCAEAEEIQPTKFRELGGGFWHKIAAINEIEVALIGAGNFAQNSKFSLYGIGGTFECFA